MVEFALPDLMIEPIVRAALFEDLGRAGDITGEACIPADARMAASFVVRRDGVVAGLACARLALHALDPAATFKVAAADGTAVRPGAVLARIEGNARAVLAAERVALNLLGRLSGVATLTAAYVAQVQGTRAQIIDTPKTTPGLRALEKYAVRCGGGANHRFGLDDAVLIKDNHVAACGGVGVALERARVRVDLGSECGAMLVHSGAGRFKPGEIRCKDVSLWLGRRGRPLTPCAAGATYR